MKVGLTKSMMAAAVIFLASAMANTGSAVTISRSVEIDLATAFSLPNDFLLPTSVSVLTSPMVFNVGDTLDVTYNFANGEALKINDAGVGDVFLQFNHPTFGITFGYTTTFTFLGVVGDLLDNGFSQPISGSLAPPILGTKDLTNSSFSFTGINVSSEITSGTPVGPYTVTNVQFAGFTMSESVFFEREIRDIPEPATLAILGLGLAGLGVLRRRRSA